MKISSHIFKPVFWTAFIVILFLNLLMWLYLNTVETQFSRNLENNLINKNRSLARTLDIDLLALLPAGSNNTLEYIAILQNLEEMRYQDSLQSISIISVNGEILVSSPEMLSNAGQTSTFETIYFKNALDKVISTTSIEKINDEYFMTSYGPLLNIDDTIIAILVIEAKAGYFQTMGNLRSQFMIYSFITIITILLIAMVLFRLTNRLINYQATIQDQQHLVQLGTLAATVAHEIRNPLGIIEGSNELIKKKYAPKDDELFDYIPAEIKRLSEIIENFLNYARNPALNVTTFSLETLLAKIKIGIPKESVKNLKIITPVNNIVLTTDANLLEQALLNIIINAFEASAGNCSVQIAIGKKGTSPVIDISDNGPGIKEDILDKVFTPFFTTKEKGTGLGLAITKKSIESLGGNISVRSQINIGTTFTITIPRVIPKHAKLSG